MVIPFLLLGIYKFSNQSSLEDKIVLIQNGDLQLLNEVLQDYKPYIKKTVSKICKRYIYDSDDEFSVGLIAFHEAIMNYHPERGASLLTFAEVVIRRKLIDKIRKDQREKANLTYDRDDNESAAGVHETWQAMEHFQHENTVRDRKEEILQYSQALIPYKLSFKELAEQAPKHSDARENAIFIARLVQSNEEWLRELKEKKKLPIKKIEKKIDLSRKTIERNRKYIIAVVILLDGDFPYLQEYVKGSL
ncbi:RNA polymerase sigma-I factor [Jeotgalibacillus sp. R-1-5s-1]|uniref:RNA polymerase sigma-I factor n=1 Tax=Jeotgalibacillus sp. R-1-5s-1 TaxID=2555897 RepID=UPI00106C013D|nr:RNA polymerase sigma-I factor [Jeotgalibacillus sp. R-1-5s-1]TFE03730.1 RNA polymerase sigma-I factor [Jeotgalibacillus sp. R-1-5s-1]